MELPAGKRPCSIEEYFRLEQTATVKHEYRFGEVVAMAGGSFEHSLIIVNTGSELRSALKGKGCHALESNLRIRIARSPLYVYPDLSVVCGPPLFDPDDAARQSVMNPKLIVEVLSPSSEAYDRGDKFSRYRQIDTFEEYVLIAQNEPSVQTYYRQPDGTWLFSPWAGMDAKARLRSLNIELALSEIYAGVEFPPSETTAATP